MDIYDDYYQRTIKHLGVEAVEAVGYSGKRQDWIEAMGADVEVLALNAGEEILDFGAGNLMLYDAIQLHHPKVKPITYTAIERNRHFFEYIQGRGIEVFTTLPSDRSWDVVALWHVLGGLSLYDATELVSQLFDVTRKRLLICNDINPENVDRLLSWADIPQVVRDAIPHFEYLEVNFATADYFTVAVYRSHIVHRGNTPASPPLA
jgi:hypothetical protein